MIVENRKEPYERLALIIREIRKEFINIEENPDSNLLCKYLIYPEYEEAMAASLTLTELREKILTPGLISYVPSIKEDGNANSKIVIYLDLSRLMAEKGKLLHIIKVDIITPKDHWEDSLGPKPLILLSLVNKILRSAKVTGLGNLILTTVSPIVVDKEEMGYTVEFAIPDFGN
jgi:hypothetical protein